jgi:hypothetical protein
VVVMSTVRSVAGDRLSIARAASIRCSMEPDPIYLPWEAPE